MSLNHESSAKEIGDAVGYSDGTVYLVAKKLGFSFPERTPGQHKKLMAELQHKKREAAEAVKAGPRPQPRQPVVFPGSNSARRKPGPAAKPKAAKKTRRKTARKKAANGGSPAPARPAAEEEPTIRLGDALVVLWPNGIPVEDYGRACSIIAHTVR